MATKRKPITLDPGRDPWDQQPRETPYQYGRFIQFRDLGRMRSLTALNRVLTDIGDEATYGTIKYHSHIYRWNERASAWDRHQDEADRARLIAARRSMIDRHQRIAGALATKALAALQKITKDTELSPADIVRLLKLSTDLEVRALGEPSQTIAVTGPAGGPIQTEDISGLTDDERRTRLQDVVTELARRAGLSTTNIDEEE